MMPYISVEKVGGEAVIRVRVSRITKYIKLFPLNRKGCLQAGEYLFNSGAIMWSKSSSVNWPRDVNPRCRLRDVGELICMGFLNAKNKRGSVQ